MSEQKIQNPINPSVKKHLDPLGDFRLSGFTKQGRKIWLRTNTQEGVLAIIADWRRLGFKNIEIWEPPRYGVTQFWDVQEIAQNYEFKKV